MISDETENHKVVVLYIFIYNMRKNKKLIGYLRAKLKKEKIGKGEGGYEKQYLPFPKCCPKKEGMPWP